MNNGAKGCTGRRTERKLIVRKKMHRVLTIFIAAALPAAAGRLVINEVYYHVSPQGGYQYVELYNAGTNIAYLDGKILTDEASTGNEGVFQFPGTPGGTTLPVAPGQFIVIAVDATNDTIAANWECYAGPTDTDNPTIPNLTLVSGSFDLGLATFGDNVILADGTDTIAPIASSTIIDAVNFAGGGGELADIGPGLPETDASISAPYGFSVGRCPDGADNNLSSTADFYAMVLTPGASNDCSLPAFTIHATNVVEGNSGSTTARVMVTLSPVGTLPASVGFFTSNGTAIAGADFAATNGLLVFSPGTRTQFVNVIVFGDTSTEPDETFTLRLTGPTNATLASAIATVTILNDDGVTFTSEFVSVRGGVGSVTTSWSSVSGLLYQVQVSPTLINPAWTNLGSVVTALSANAFIVDTDPAATTRFYRVLQNF
jgi:hypothetical protein